MLEDELREMFAARVRTAPAAADPAGVAIKRGRRTARRRAIATGTAAVVLLVAGLGGAIGWRSALSPQPTVEAGMTWQTLYGDVVAYAPSTDRRPLPSFSVLVRSGDELWTDRGKQVTLDDMPDVSQVVRVPSGLIYSNEMQVRMLDSAGKSVPLAAATSWTVSQDGEYLASVQGAEVRVTPVTDRSQSVRLTVSASKTTKPVVMVGSQVVIENEGEGFAHVSEGAPFAEEFDAKLLAVYGNPGQRTVGLRRDTNGTLCLVDVEPVMPGFDSDTILACGGILAILPVAAVASPGGQWLAVMTVTGVHIVDVGTTRKASANQAKSGQAERGIPVVKATCPYRDLEEVAWASDSTVLVASANDELVACQTDGTKRVVQLPKDTPAGWDLVPVFGTSD